MKKLILHVGIHKTATSSIQQTLADNRKNLELQGYYYPIFNRDNEEIINHSIPFFSVFCENPQSYHINIINGDSRDILNVNKKYLEQIENVLKMESNVIISGEDICALNHNSLIALKTKILKAGFSLEVYCSVRETYSFTCSEIQERIKSGYAQISDLKVLEISSFYKNLKNVFEDVITFYSFEEDCHYTGPVVNFLRRIGVDSRNFIIHNSNEGIGNISTRLFGYLNSEFSTIKDGQLNIKRRKIFVNSFDRDKFLLTEAEYNLISPLIKEERDRVRNILGSRFVNENCVFSEQITINIQTAIQIIDSYFEQHTIRAILTFIDKYSNFQLFELCAYFPDNADVLRDISLLLQTHDLESAFLAMKLAKKARPSGPVINKKLIEFQHLLSKI